jgi:2-polyprenyl-3-methyl-5-hydroxy-6-metoxy-1,4-benzoquinol methylase
MKSEWMWDRLAKNWDKPGVNLGGNDIRIVEKTKKYLNGSCNLLDYGCATGSISFEIAKIVKGVHGIDISSKMIDIAKRKAVERQLKNVNFSQATIFDESLEKESFDIIMAFSILHLLENTPQVMDRINELLKPGGFFISATPCLGERKLVSLAVNLPVFLLSKIGVLPGMTFFNVSGLVNSITSRNFHVIETESLAVRPITEVFIAGEKREAA